MAFQSLADLPESAQQLPQNGQQIFQAAYNSASEDGMSEEAALQVAWDTVKEGYFQAEDGSWHLKNDLTTSDNRSKAVQSGGN